MAHAQSRVTALLDVSRRSAEAPDEEVAKALFSPDEIVSRIHRSEDVVFGYLFVEGVDKLLKAVFADAFVDLVFADQTTIIPSAALSWEA